MCYWFSYLWYNSSYNTHSMECSSAINCCYIMMHIVCNILDKMFHWITMFFSSLCQSRNVMQNDGTSAHPSQLKWYGSWSYCLHGGLSNWSKHHISFLFSKHCPQKYFQGLWNVSHNIIYIHNTVNGWIDVMLIINGFDITLNEFRYSSNDVSRLSRLSFTLFLEVAYIIEVVII